MQNRDHHKHQGVSLSSLIFIAFRCFIFSEYRTFSRLAIMKLIHTVCRLLTISGLSSIGHTLLSTCAISHHEPRVKMPLSESALTSTLLSVSVECSLLYQCPHFARNDMVAL